MGNWHRIPQIRARKLKFSSYFVFCTKHSPCHVDCFCGGGQIEQIGQWQVFFPSGVDESGYPSCMGMAQNFAPAESYSIVYTSLYMSRPGSFLGHFYLIIAKFLLPWSLILSRAHTCICHTYPRVTRTMYQTGHKMVQGSHGYHPVCHAVKRCCKALLLRDQICNQSRDQPMSTT